MPLHLLPGCRGVDSECRFPCLPPASRGCAAPAKRTRRRQPECTPLIASRFPVQPVGTARGLSGNPGDLLAEADFSTGSPGLLGHQLCQSLSRLMVAMIGVAAETSHACQREKICCRGKRFSARVPVIFFQQTVPGYSAGTHFSGQDLSLRSTTRVERPCSAASFGAGQTARPGTDNEHIVNHDGLPLLGLQAKKTWPARCAAHQPGLWFKRCRPKGRAITPRSASPPGTLYLIWQYFEWRCPLGQTASHSLTLVQLPKPSSSI